MSRTHAEEQASRPLRLAVIWIDWYAYHVARFRGILETPELAGRALGIELVGGIGVHAGLKFREPLPPDLPVHTLFPDSAWNEVNPWTAAFRLWKELSNADPEAVLVPGYYTLPGIAAALWARAHHRRSILMTESTAYDHARSPWKERCKGLLLRLLFDQAVTGGKAHVRYLHDLGFPPDKIAGCYDVVDNNAMAQGVAAVRAEQTPSRFGLPATPYFLYVGRLAPEKNLEGLLAAWLQYRLAGGSWPLVLVGDGPKAEALKAQAAQSAFAADVVFTGLRGSTELRPIYAFAGCFVLPSWREPWGLVVNEAMAASLPVLVSDRCGSSEDLLVQGENGFRFSPDQTEELAARMTGIATASSSERNAFGRRSAEIVSAYSPQGFGQQIANLLCVDEQS